MDVDNCGKCLTTSLVTRVSNKIFNIINLNK